ncbi:MAG: hypothetical protein JXB25_13165 [Deltaproteobacteria bacterium]|nr:hypothetical protein [Deltaproteobacteria bacterium]
MLRTLRRITLLAGLLFFALGFLSCSKEFTEGFQQLFPLRDAIIKEFNEKDVRVVIQNGHCIGVSFINSQYNQEPASTQDQVREKTLELISSHYSQNDKIEMAWIAFVKHDKQFFIVNIKDATNNKFYKKLADGSWVALF